MLGSKLKINLIFSLSALNKWPTPSSSRATEARITFIASLRVNGGDDSENNGNDIFNFSLLFRFSAAYFEPLPLASYFHLQPDYSGLSRLCRTSLSSNSIKGRNISPSASAMR
jgi:hypothetical protein